MAEQYNRRFEGIWIPANIWLSEELTMQEKIFLVEIKSLDNEQGCFASNDHFAKLFQLSKSRCSEVINKLKEKGLITVYFAFKEGSKQIERRTIRVNFAHEIFNEGIRKTEAPIRDSEGGTRKVEDPPSEKAKDNNTFINNTSYINKATTTTRKDALSYFMENVRFNLNSIEIETIQHWEREYPYDLVIEAIKRTALANKNYLRYTEGILIDWQNKRISTLEEVARDDAAFEQKRGGKPNASNRSGNKPNNGYKVDLGF